MPKIAHSAESFHEAWQTRGLDARAKCRQVGQHAMIKEILALCHEEAQLLDFKKLCEYQLADRMATSEQEVMDFSK